MINHQVIVLNRGNPHGPYLATVTRVYDEGKWDYEIACQVLNGDYFAMDVRRKDVIFTGFVHPEGFKVQGHGK